MTRTLHAYALAATAFLAVAAMPHPAHANGARPFVDQRGARFGLRDFRGTSLVLTFVSAHCTEACPIIDAQIAAAASRARKDDAPTRFLTLTLDPERDTLRDMRRIAHEFHADPRRWVVGDGSSRAIHALMRTLGVKTERGPSGFARAHSVYVYIFDSNGRLVRELLPSTDLTSQLLGEVAL